MFNISGPHPQVFDILVERANQWNLVYSNVEDDPLPQPVIHRQAWKNKMKRIPKLLIGNYSYECLFKYSDKRDS